MLRPLKTETAPLAYFLTILVLLSLTAVFGFLLNGRDPGTLGKPVDWTRRVLSGEIPYERAVVDTAKWIAPLWAVLILLVLWAIGDLFAASSGLEDDDLRWHYLAIGSMFLASAA